jgi:hypothetical protein
VATDVPPNFMTTEDMTTRLEPRPSHHSQAGRADD